MKQYIMGMLTGASLILCAVMFMGLDKDPPMYRWAVYDPIDDVIVESIYVPSAG